MTQFYTAPINLVISQGFNFKKYLNQDLDLSEITAEDLTDDSLNQLSEKIKIEVGDDVDLNLLRFLSSKLSLEYTAREQQLIGMISQVSSTIFPNLAHNPNNSYTLLIDELQRKGVEESDFNKWDDFLANKGLTHEQINSVLKAHTTDGFSEIKSTFDDISDSLAIKPYEKAFYRRELERLHTNIVFSQRRHCIRAIETVEAIFQAHNFQLNNITPSVFEIFESYDFDNLNNKVVVTYCIVKRILNYEEFNQL